jgi:anti-sigma B factor antagonist
MEMNFVDPDASTRRVTLMGRLDTLGVGEIETRFSAVASGRMPRTLIDLAGVTFLASMGIRMLVSCAKSAAGRGGRVVLVGPQPLVEQSLRDAGIDHVIPIAADDARAEEILRT